MNGNFTVLLVIAAFGAFAAGNENHVDSRVEPIPQINPSDSVSQRILAEHRLSELREILESLISEDHLAEIPWLEARDHSWLLAQLRRRAAGNHAPEKPLPEDQ